MAGREGGRERQRERQRETERDRERQRETERQRERQRERRETRDERETDRQRETERHRERQRERRERETRERQRERQRERYWMHELHTVFLYRLNDKIWNKFETDNAHINVASKFLSLSRKYSLANCGKNHEGVPLLLPQQCLDNLNHMLNTNIKDVLNFIRTSLANMKKSI